MSIRISPSPVGTENPRRQEDPPLPLPQPSAESWDVTQERMLLYLKCLHVSPGRDQLSLALEAVSRVGHQRSKQDITPAAMQALRSLLKTSGLSVMSAGDATLYSMGPFRQDLQGLKSAPSLNRGHMLPVKFEQLPEWLSTESSLATLIIQLRPLLIPLLILFNILLLVGLFFWL